MTYWAGRPAQQCRSPLRVRWQVAAPPDLQLVAGWRPRRYAAREPSGATLAGIARLIHLNGPPGSGKSSLANRYLADHPLTLVVDLDGLRTSLGQWSAHVESQLLARDLAVALIDCHLDAGHDVVIPQFLGRLAFIERLEAVADRHDAEFVEVILVCERHIAADRFRARRRELLSLGIEHPERDVDDERVDAAVDDAIRLLADVATARPGARIFEATPDLGHTYRHLLDALADPAR